VAELMWKIAGACVPGTSHQATGRPCEDALAWSATDDLTCIAVADGAGSRSLSGQGSALAVRTALSAASARVSGPDAGEPAAWLPAIFADVRKELSQLAREQGRDVGDYATTLAVVILTGDLACVGQIGDAIVVVCRSGAYETVAPPPCAEYVNETSFVTEERAVDDARITVFPEAAIDAVFLSTDGLRFRILDDLASAAPFAPFFDDLSAYMRSPDATADAIRQFLIGLTNDQTGDDKTLVAAVRGRPPQLAGAPLPVPTLAVTDR
jgi:Protein phosphatase 2C